MAKRELINTGADKRFVRRDAKGQFKDVVDVGRSLAADRRVSKDDGEGRARRQGRSVMEEEPAQPRREIDVCMTCSQFEHEEETPHCRKFRAWPEEVVEDCGGPY